MPIRVKRIYGSRADDDGVRVLVDRVWPRRVSKAEADIDLWLKDIAPSDELRRWFDHDPAKWAEFRRRYESELRNNMDAVALLRDKIAGKKAVLLYGAKDTEHNQAIVLRDFMERQISGDHDLKRHRM